MTIATVAGGGTRRETKDIVFSDFPMSFAKSPISGDLTKIINSAAVRQSIRNLILTNSYERPFQNQNIGGNIRAYLFELINPLSAFAIARTIEETIDNHEKRAQLISVKVLPNQESNQYTATIVFRTVNQPKAETLTVILEKVR
jgi:phage baseplate assembly protein W